MFDQFLELSSMVGGILLTTPAMLSADELVILRELRALLQPLEQVAQELCGEKYVRISMVIPIVTCMERYVANIKVQTAAGASIQNQLTEEIARKFKEVEKVKLISTSTILDPRFKRMHFGSVVNAANAVTRVATMMRHAVTNRTPAEEENECLHKPEHNEGIQGNKQDLWNFHDSLMAESKLNAGEDVSGLPVELEMYLQQPSIDRKSCPYKFWREQKTIFPNLYNLAMKYLPVLATSVPSERLFSKAGLTIGQDRCRLIGKRLNRLVFLGSLEDKYWKI